MGKLAFPGSRTPFAIFSLSSLHLPLLFISLLLLSPPLLKEKHFCSATHCAIFGPLCSLPFKDAVAVVGASRKYYTDALVCEGGHAAQVMSIYPMWSWWWETTGRHTVGVSRMLTKGLLKEVDKAGIGGAPRLITKSSVPWLTSTESQSTCISYVSSGRQLSVTHGQ